VALRRQRCEAAQVRAKVPLDPLGQWRDDCLSASTSCSATPADLLGRRTPQGERIASTDLSRYLLEEAGVATVPGSAFALDLHLRLSYAAPEALLTAATARIAAALNRLN
jgi:aspartate aminotransferase